MCGEGKASGMLLPDGEFLGVYPEGNGKPLKTKNGEAK